MPRPASARWGVAVLAALLLGASPTAAQYRLTGPADTIAFDRDSLLRMRERSRVLRQDLEEDPEVLYYTTFGRPADPEDPAPSLPWNAVDVVTDSLAAVITPGDLREADRAYVNYAVLRMRAVRSDPDVPCDTVMARELEAVGGFVEGWVVARTLFGGPPYAPLDELVFARRDAVLAGLVAAREDPYLGGCVRVWREAHPDAVEAYRRWRAAREGAASG